MVHLPALPGAAGASSSMDRIIDRAVAESALLANAGFDAAIVENFGDTPFSAESVSPETISAMALVVDRIVRTVGIPVGVNVLRNDSLAALAIAATAGAVFIRVNVLSGIYATDQGFITGRAEDLVRQRKDIAAHVKIAADVHVKHAQPISQPDIGRAAEETAYRAGADALIVSGPATGAETDVDALRRVAKAVRDRPIWVGSGVSATSVNSLLDIADAVIVGTSLKRGGKTTAPLDPRRVKAFVQAAR